MRPLDPRLVRHLRPAARSLTGLVAAGLVGSGLLVVQAFAVAHLLVLVAHGEVGGVPGAAGLVGVVVALRAAAGYASDLCAACASATVSGQLRRRLVRTMLGLSAQDSTRQRTGELSLLVTRGVAALEPYLTRYLPALLLAATLPLLILVAIASQDLLSAAIVAGTLPLMPVFAILVGMATRDRAERQWVALSALAGHFVDVVRGLPTLVVHGRAQAQTATIRRVSEDHRRASLSTLRLAFASSAVLELVATLSVALVAVVVGVRLAAGSLDLRTALVVLLLAPEAYWPVRRVGAEFHAAAEGTATFVAAEELLARARTERVRALGVVAPASAAPSAGREVRARGVRVRYPGRAAPALDHPGDLVLPARGLVAVVGPSGSGKSTLLAALAGEVALEGGSISADGEPLEAGSLDRWRRQVAWLPQRPWLGDATVRESLTVGRPDADDPALWAALERVGLREVVAGLPRGLDAPVGEDGERFSAGQRARLALARGVLARRPLVLVDEPSAHLDRASETLILDTLTWLSRRSTVVVVTHSPRLLAAADEVVRLEAAPTLPAAPLPRAVAAAAAGTRAAADPSPSGHVDRPTSRRTPSSARGWALSVLLGIGAAGSGVALTVTSGWLIARAAEHPPILLLAVAIVGVRTFGIARPVLRYGERLIGHDSALRLLAERRAAVYATVVPLTPGALGRHRGDVLTTIVDDVDAVLDERLRVRSPLLVLLGSGLLGTIFATLLLPRAGVLVAALVLAVVLVAVLLRRSVSRVEEVVVRSRARLAARVLQTASDARQLVLWQATRRAEDAVDEAGVELDQATRASATRVATARAVVTVAAGACLAGLAVSLGPAVTSSQVSGPMAVALLLLPLALLEVLAGAPDAAATSVRTRAAARRLDDLVGARPAVTSPARPVDPPPSPVGLTTDALSCGWDEAVFAGLTLDLAPGRRVGVVGPSGSGKSTLAAALVRFLDPHHGSVALGDARHARPVDLRSLDLDTVHRVVGLVDDDPYVFSSSVLENVRLARPGADREDVARVLEQVSLGPWLAALPEGLDTWVGEGHAGVSGGERARLGLARAMLARHEVLVMDEPTAHLDAGTAQAVAEDILRATAGRAVVWITHDEVALAAMDEVVDLADHALGLPGGGTTEGPGPSRDQGPAGSCPRALPPSTPSREIGGVAGTGGSTQEVLR